MKKPRWINSRAVLLLHAETLAEHGGLPGIRDRAGLESALARPQHLNHDKPRSDAARLAAAYGFGIVRSHPFVDGNKRVSFLAINLFLSLNDLELDVDQVEAVETIRQLAAGRISEDALAEWIRENS